MGGASSKEVEEGSAVTGKHCQRVVMPSGVVGEQLRGGMWPGAKFLRFTPKLLDELLVRKGAKGLYAEFSKEMSRDCGGESFKGWSSPAIQLKVTAFQERFNKVGIRVTYHQVVWHQWVSTGQTGYMQKFYKYWLTYAEMDVPPVTLQADAYDPEKDYDKAAAAEVATAVGTVVHAEVGKLERFDPVGRWTLDVESQKPSVALTEGAMTITREGDRLRCVGAGKYPIFCLKKSLSWDQVLENPSPNVYVASVDLYYGASVQGGTVEIAMTSAATMSVMSTTAATSVAYQMTYTKADGAKAP